MNWSEKYRPVNFDDLWQKKAPGLNLLKRAVGARRLAQLIIIVGAYGVGKTSLARIVGRRFNCLQITAHPYNPCGVCDSCRDIAPFEGGTFVRDGYIEYDVTCHTPAHITAAIREQVQFYKMYANPDPDMPTEWIVCLDEVARVKNNMQESLLKAVENLRTAKFVLCFSDPATIIPPLRERGLLIELPLPTTQEATQALLRMARSEGFTLDSLAANHIVESVRRVPRRCVLALEQASVLADSGVIGLEAAEAAVQVVAR